MPVTWLDRKPVMVPPELTAVVGGHFLVAQTLARRGFKEPQASRAFLSPEAYRPSPPREMRGMATAVKRIQFAIDRGELICVWGDFDVDGQTATTLLVSALMDLGARVCYHIPVRAVESHGVNIPVLGRLIDENPAIRLLLTCDTGVSAHEALLFAENRGLDVVVTDHHDIPEVLPKAHTILNPKFLPLDHPLRDLPGVAVAYKLVEGLYEQAGRRGQEAQYLDLVALGIVADVAEQRKDTRFLLQCGLALLRAPQRMGLRSIMEIAELSPDRLTEEHIGFVIGPRLNALGRLSDANPIVELLTTEDEGRARTLAYQLEALNARRRLLTSQVYKGALAQLARDPKLLSHSALVLGHPDWPAGVIGIVASRLVERYHKPVILISTPPGDLGRASARSVEGVDITAAIAAQSDILAGYGGHTMAAGFAIDTDRIPEFRRRIGRSIDASGNLPEPGLLIDAYLPLAELDLMLVKDLERLAPFGAGNPPLVFVGRDIQLVKYRTLGRDQEHLLLEVQDEQGEKYQLIRWGGAGILDTESLPEGRFDLAYRARSTTFNGSEAVQLEWVDYRITKDRVELRPTTPQIKIKDYRDEIRPLPLLESVAGDFQIWAEAADKAKLVRAIPLVDICARHELKPADSLIIWTIPPGKSELDEVLRKVSPHQITLFAIDPGMDNFQVLLRRLTGMVKFVLESRQGLIDLPALAAALAHRPILVRKGLDWLAARGSITVVSETPEEIHIVGGGEQDKKLTSCLEDEIETLLEETRAYRSYYQRAPVTSLITFE